MRSLILGTLCFLAVSACATTEAAKSDLPPAVTEAEAKQQPQPTQAPSKQPIGWTPLPKGLEQDPSKLEIGKLDFSVVKPERMTLDNGIQLYLMPDPAVPLINIRAQFALGTF